MLSRIYAQLRRLSTNRMVVSTTWSAISLGAAALVGVITARSLGPAGRGELGLALAVGALFSMIGALGSNVSIRKNLRAQNAVTLGDYLRVSLYLMGSTTLLLVICYSALVTIGPIEASCGFFLAFISFGLSSFVCLQSIDAVYAVAAPIVAARYSAYSTLATLLVTIAVTFIGPSPSSYLVGYAAGSLLATLFCCLFIKKANISTESSRAGVRALFSDGVRLLGMNSGQAFTAQMPTLLLGGLSTTTHTGLFTAASTPAGLFRVPANVLAQLSMVDSSAAKIRMSYFWKRLLTLLLGSTIVGIAAIVAAPWLISLIYGREFLPAVGVFRILVVAEILFVPYIVMSKVLAVRGRAIHASFAGLTGLIVSAASGYLLITHLDALGAAISATLAYSAMSIYVIWSLRNLKTE